MTTSDSQRGTDSKVFKVLSIDGGGIRGLIPALWLAKLEAKKKKKTGKCVRVADMFDLICGTSAGGIIACGLTRPGQEGPVPARDLVKLFKEQGDDIFDRSFLRRVSSLGGFAEERYGHAKLEAILKKYFGHYRLSDLAQKPRLLVTSYNIGKSDLYFFKSRRAHKRNRNHYLRDVARATSAAPSYFEPTKVKSTNGNIKRALIDGGVFANNPAMCAYAEARKITGAQKKIMIVSLGTGSSCKNIRFKKAKGRGTLCWAKPAIDIMFDGASDSVDYQLKQLLHKKNYYRFDTRSLNIEMDATDKHSIKRMKKAFWETMDMKANKAEFKALCKRL